MLCSKHYDSILQSRKFLLCGYTFRVHMGGVTAAAASFEGAD